TPAAPTTYAPSAPPTPAAPTSLPDAGRRYARVRRTPGASPPPNRSGAAPPGVVTSLAPAAPAPAPALPPGAVAPAAGPPCGAGTGPPAPPASRRCRPAQPLRPPSQARRHLEARRRLPLRLRDIAHRLAHRPHVPFRVQQSVGAVAVELVLRLRKNPRSRLAS